MTTWSRGEIAVIAGAVRSAPSVHNTQPWVVQFNPGSVSLFERLDLSLPRHDPTGRDRLISCGAGLANLVLAVRVLGWDAQVLTFPDRGRRDEVARIITTGRRAPSRLELGRYAALRRRHTHRGRFSPVQVPEELRESLCAPAADAGARVRPLAGPAEYAVLAALLGEAAAAVRGDRGYQRELAAWTNDQFAQLDGDGVLAPDPADDTLPWVGLVRTSTSLPQPDILAARLARELLLVVVTPGDGTLDHLLAGRTVQHTWLDAVGAGLVGSVLTQPLHVHGVRLAMAERLHLAGYPQVLLRLGHPADVARRSPRVAVTNLIATAGARVSDTGPAGSRG